VCRRWCEGSRPGVTQGVLLAVASNRRQARRRPHAEALMLTVVRTVEVFGCNRSGSGCERRENLLQRVLRTVTRPHLGSVGNCNP